MGTWGRAILSDDFARDVYDEYLRLYDAGRDREEITRHLLSAHSADLDEDDGPVFWLALAKAQWDTGEVSADVLSRVATLVVDEGGLERWREAGPRELAKRKAVLADFALRVRTPNPAPRKPKSAKQGRAPFPAGTCLAVLLPDGNYGAAIVLAVKEGTGSSGVSLVGTLRYKAPEPPDRQVFETRDWLTLMHHAHRGGLFVVWCLKVKWRQFRHLFQVAGQTQVVSSDPTVDRSYCRWDHVPDQIDRQFRWDSGDRT